MFPFEDEADAVVYDDYGAPVDDDIFKPSEEALGGYWLLLVLKAACCPESYCRQCYTRHRLQRPGSTAKQLDRKVAWLQQQSHCVDVLV